MKFDIVEMTGAMTALCQDTVEGEGNMNSYKLPHLCTPALLLQVFRSRSLGSVHLQGPVVMVHFEMNNTMEHCYSICYPLEKNYPGVRALSTDVFTKHTVLSLPIPQCNEATARARPPSSLLSCRFFSLMVLTNRRRSLHKIAGILFANTFLFARATTLLRRAGETLSFIVSIKGN
ncbi:hypothetical protein F2P81_020107 [Scophthalmus maximus]|uniref:Uncharacterized protein n=1 Tax=Scophthalmus maximus TaxID=52904 RepID=A0A6A4RX32_SCOMX|nr:hypothetical protein F2P81_020107 [Scophthalmus maximus]